MSDECNCCGWPLESDEHVFNVNCAASNAEYDQVLAHVAECQSLPSTPEMEQGFEKAKEAVAETLAYMRFVRDLTRRQ